MKKKDIDEESEDDDYWICYYLKQFIVKFLVKLTWRKILGKKYDKCFQRYAYLLNQKASYRLLLFWKKTPSKVCIWKVVKYYFLSILM